MKRILITPEIEALAKEYADNLFADRTKSFKMPKDNLKNLEGDLHSHQVPTEYEDYVNTIYMNYEKILKLRPIQFKEWIKKFNRKVSPEQCSKSVPKYTSNKPFFELVVDAMRYDDVRDKEFRPYVRKLGIKACVYCNAQFAITTIPDKSSSRGTYSKSGDYRATYQLDHFLPKSRYPFLCTSFFNLQPACAHCNDAKGNRRAKFSLYTECKDGLTPFKFKLDDNGVINYWLSHNCNDLKVKLDATDPNDKDRLLKSHRDMFHIDELYSELSDVVEEIVWKSKIYNDSYIEQLQRSFNDLVSEKPQDLKRFILGNYADIKDIHKRPLALMVQSVARELGLI